MHTFDRLTPRAKKALALAQERAQADNANISPEHVVLGMLSERRGMGPRLLTLLGVDSGKLTTELGPGPDQPGVESSGTVPTTEVGHVLRLAIEEANLLGHQAVNAEHLLLGVLAEGTSRAAVALAASGATLERVREQVRRQGPLPAARVPISGRQPMTDPDLPNSPEVARTLHEARQRAEREDALSLRLDHLLLAIFSQPDGRAVLRVLGIDAAALRRLAAPPAIVSAQKNIRTLRARAETAIDADDYQTASEVRDLEQQATAALGLTIRDWIFRTWWNQPGDRPAPGESLPAPRR